MSTDNAWKVLSLLQVDKSDEAIVRIWRPDRSHNRESWWTKLTLLLQALCVPRENTQATVVHRNKYQPHE